ncbi:MAG: hypothetical protein Q8P67_25985, partial [archaeon]|nr:hypothetical protein [archaeon]
PCQSVMPKKKEEEGRIQMRGMSLFEAHIHSVCTTKRWKGRGEADGGQAEGMIRVLIEMMVLLREGGEVNVREGLLEKGRKGKGVPFF